MFKREKQDKRDLNICKNMIFPHRITCSGSICQPMWRVMTIATPTDNFVITWRFVNTSSNAFYFQVFKNSDRKDPVYMFSIKYCQ